MDVRNPLTFEAQRGDKVEAIPGQEPDRSV
jgi:hypothetical protein